jgi:hypothetical protein
MYWQAVYWKYVSKILEQDEGFKEICASAVIMKLFELQPCYVCHKLAGASDHVRCMQMPMQEEVGIEICLAHFCPEHVPAKGECPCCDKRARDKEAYRAAQTKSERIIKIGHEIKEKREAAARQTKTLEVLKECVAQDIVRLDVKKPVLSDDAMEIATHTREH